MHQPRCTQARRHQQVVLFLQAQGTPHNPEPKHAGEHVGCAFTFIERNATRHANCLCGPDALRLTQHLHTAQTHGVLPPTPKTSQNSHAPRTHLFLGAAMCCSMCPMCCRAAGPCANRIHSFSARLPQHRNSSRKAGSAGATDISSSSSGSTAPQNSKGNFGRVRCCCCLPRMLLLRRRADSRDSR